jgi:hypothetical protein
MDTTTNAPALTYDEILAGGSIGEDVVMLCLNGKLRRQYEAVKERIDQRTADHEAEQEAAQLALRARRNIMSARQAETAAADDRLVTKSTPATDDDQDETPAAYVDPEQPELDRLVEQMKRYTVPYTIRALPDQDWNRLLEAHPPRRDPADAKRLDPRDFEGVNSSTFYADLVRQSIAEPTHDDARWTRLMELVTSKQFDKLATVAAEVNKRDENLPFSLADLGTRPG